MRYFLCSLLLLVIPTGADAARLYTMGFEWNSITSGVEWTTTTGTIATSTTVVRSGQYSMRVNASASTGYIYHNYLAADSAPAFARCYFRFASFPAGLTTIAQIVDTAGATGAMVRINSTGTLELWNSTTAQLGSDSSALSLNTWYRIEWSHIAGGARAMIDGVDFASSTVAHTNGDNMSRVRCGVIDSATMDVYVDDVAVNNNANGSQTSFPGAGSIVRVVPTGDGDNNCTSGAGDWANVNEVPPSNTATAGGTNICELDTTTSIADFNVTNSSTAGIDSYDTITLVWIWGRVREEAAGTSNYTLRMKSASGGTTSVSSSQDAGDATTVRTNPSGTTAFSVKHVTYTDPTTGIAWTPTGTNSIDNMQIGAATTDGTPDTWLTTIAGMIEYVDGTPPAGGTPQDDTYFEILSFVVPIPKDILTTLREILFV